VVLKHALLLLPQLKVKALDSALAVVFRHSENDAAYVGHRELFVLQNYSSEGKSWSRLKIACAHFNESKTIHRMVGLCP